jgi:hypothetical protein
MSVQREAASLVKKVGVEVAAAGVGLLAGGPLGALAGAAAAPVVELVLSRERHALRSMEILVEMVTNLSGVSADRFTAWAEEREGRLFLATSALQAASEARAEYKIRALARVLVDNLRDDAQLDLASLTVAGLAELDPPHVRVLHAIVHDVPPDAPELNPGKEHGWSCVALRQHLPGLADGIMPIIATLTRTGMITEATDSTNDRLSWVATRFGISCMNYLGDIA